MKPHAMSRTIMSAQSFAGLGSGQIAYVKAISANELKARYPQLQPLNPDEIIFALCGADGTLIDIASTRAEVRADAKRYQLVTVSVH